MPDTTTDTAVADTGGTAQNDSENTGAQAGQADGQQGHHSQRQPRDEAKRFTRVVKRHGKDVTEEATEADFWRARDELDRVKHLEKTSTERFQRASQVQKETQTVQQIAQALVKRDIGPLKEYFAQHKLDPKDALADLLDDVLADASLTEEQRELMQLRAEKQSREEQDRRQKEDTEVAAFYKEVDALRPEVEKIWQYALTQTNLPKTAKMMEITSRTFLEAAEAGTRLSPEQVAEFARWELVQVNGAMVNELEPGQFFQHFQPLAKKIDESMSAEDFEKTLPVLAKRYHRYLVAKLKSGGSTRGAAPAQGTPQRTTSGGTTAKPRQLSDPFLDDVMR